VRPLQRGRGEGPRCGDTFAVAVLVSAGADSAAVGGGGATGCRLAQHRHTADALAADVATLLESCDRSTPVGVRDFAIMILVARLGLRSIEVARLELGDVD
jgi:integrase